MFSFNFPPPLPKHCRHKSTPRDDVRDLIQAMLVDGIVSECICAALSHHCPVGRPACATSLPDGCLEDVYQELRIMREQFLYNKATCGVAYPMRDEWLLKMQRDKMEDQAREILALKAERDRANTPESALLDQARSQIRTLEAARDKAEVEATTLRRQLWTVHNKLAEVSALMAGV